MTAGIFSRCEETKMSFKTSLRSFAALKASWNGSGWSPPTNLQNMLPLEPARAVLDCVCFACSCTEPAPTFSGQFCKHLGFLSAWAEHNSSDSTWTAATTRAHSETDTLRVHVLSSARVEEAWRESMIWEEDFLPLIPRLLVAQMPLKHTWQF